MRRFAPLLAVSLALLAPAAAYAQTSSEPEVRITDVNTSRYEEGGNTTMVVAFQNFSESVDPSQLTVTANGQPATVTAVEPMNESSVPVGIVLTIDTSGSMEGAPMEQAKAAATAFVQGKRANDYIALVTFADTVQVLSGFTADTNALTSRITGLTAAGETALYDGLMGSIALFDEGLAVDLRPNVVVLSDGTDTNSTATIDDVIAEVRDPNRPVRVFGVALESPDYTPDALQQIVDASDGGKLLSTPNPAELGNLYDEIQQEINNVLVLRVASPINTPGTVEFAVEYQGLSSTYTATNLPGFTTTTQAPPSTTTTFASAPTYVESSNLPLSTTWLIVIAAVGAGAALFMFGWILFGPRKDDPSTVFQKRLEAYGRKKNQEKESKSIFERLPLLNRFSQAAEEEVRRRGMLSGVNGALEQANIPLSPGEALLGAFGLSALVGVFVALFSRNVLTGVIIFVVGVLIVISMVSYAGKREKSRFENQLPDTLTLIATSLRAGYSLLQAVEAVAAEAPNPTSREFGRAIAEARLGRPVVQALEGITQRTQSKDFEWAVMAIEIQREVGGNLAEVLQTVADTMLARNRLRGEIKALTAEGRISAWVLALLPFLMALFLWTTNRPYLEVLFTNRLGVIALIAGAVLMIGGIFWLRRIVDIEV
jgi:tight adherence protein B